MSDQDVPKEEIEEQLAPYVIEGARSSRSKCKTCRKKIDMGALRIGILIEGPYGTGYMWHHLKCAARRQFDRVEEAYELEAWKAAKSPPEKVPDLDELRKMREQAEDRKLAKKTIPYAELAPSSRAKCKHCDEPVIKGRRVVTFLALLEMTRLNLITVHQPSEKGTLYLTPIHANLDIDAAEIQSSFDAPPETGDEAPGGSDHVQ